MKKNKNTVKSINRNVRSSPRKVNLLLKNIRGKKADIAIFDMKKPHIGVLHRPISNFICAGRGSDAKVVIVNGRVVFQDGKCAAGPDLNDIFCKAQSISRSIIEKAGLSARLEPLWRT